MNYVLWKPNIFFLELNSTREMTHYLSDLLILLFLETLCISALEYKQRAIITPSVHCCSSWPWPQQSTLMYTLQAYQYFGYISMAPLIITNIVVAIFCFKRGISADISYIFPYNYFLERHNPLYTRVLTFLLSLLGVYPQYSAVKTVLIGRGWMGGNWEQEHETNMKTLYVIEPVIESLLQVNIN